MTRRLLIPAVSAAAAMCAAFAAPALDAQGGGQQVVLDRLQTMPGYEQYTKMQEAMRGGPVFVSGSLSVTWDENSSGFTYNHAGKAPCPLASTTNWACATPLVRPDVV